MKLRLLWFCVLCNWVSLPVWAAVQIDPAFQPAFSAGSSGHFDAVQPDGKVLVNGLAARYNPDGTRDTGFTAPNNLGVVEATVVAPDGKIVVFSRNGADEALTLLNADGTLSATLSTSIVPMSLLCIAVQADGKVIASGDMTINGSRQTTLVRLNRDGTRDTTFDAGAGPNAQVEILAPQADGKLLVAGYFSSFDNIARAGFARLNADGTVDTSLVLAQAVSNSVNAVVPLPGGKILVAEQYGAANGNGQLVRLNADGSVDAVLGTFSGGSGIILALAVQADAQVLFAGGFNTFNGTPLHDLGRLDATGALDTSFAAGGYDTDVNAVAVDGTGRIYANTVGGALLRLTPAGQSDPSFAVGPARASTIFGAARLADGRVVAVGQFVSVNGVARGGLCRFQANGTVDASFNPGAPLSWYNNPSYGPTNSAAVAVQSDGSVIVGGTFTIGGTAPRSGLARYRADGSVDATFGPTLSKSGTVASLLTLADDRVVIGGSFSSVNGQARGNIAALLADGTLDSAFAATAATNAPVTTLASRSSGGLLVAGSFTTVGGTRRDQLAALANDGTLDAGFAPTTLASTDTITALASANDGGVFIAIPKAPHNGYPRAQIVRLKATGEVDPAFAFPFDINATFTALLGDAQGGVIAGYAETEGFGIAATVTYHYLHRFTASGTFDTDFDIGNGLSADASLLLTEADGTLLVGGNFTTVDDLSTSPLIHYIAAQAAPARLVNISARGDTDVGANVLTAGFVIAGTQPKTVLLRAVGPTLSSQGISGPLADPRISVYRLGASTPFLNNSRWVGDPAIGSGAQLDQGFNVAVTGQRLGAFALQSITEAGVVVTLDPGLYTAQVSGEAGTTPNGVALVEVYDANRPTGDRRLVNISSRARVNAGERVLIGGFVVAGSTPQKVLVRAIGPTLATMSVDAPLADPKLELYSMTTGKISENDNWGGTAELSAAFTATGAFALPADSKDAALLITLQPGAYSTIVSGVNGTSGVALVEVYAVP